MSFFIFSGYYVLLVILISSGLINSTRTYTIPLRLLTTIIMFFLLFKNLGKTNKSTLLNICFITFWIIYFMKIVIHKVDLHVLNRSWYEYIFYAVNFCILPFLVFSKIDFNRYKKDILNGLIFSGFMLGVVSLFLYRDIILLGVGRISDAKYMGFDETLSPLALSYSGSLTLMLCFHELIHNKNKKLAYNIYLYVTIILSSLMFFLGSSRGSIIAIVVTLPLFIIYAGRKNIYKIILNFSIGIPLFIYGVYKTGSSIFIRTSDTIESGEYGRGHLWSDAWNEFLNNPFIGGRIEIGFYPHNFILEILMATGFLGFIIFFLILFKGFINIYKKSFVDSGYSYVFIILVQGLVQYSFSGALYFAVLLFFPLGIAYSKLNYND